MGATVGADGAWGGMTAMRGGDSRIDCAWDGDDWMLSPRGRWDLASIGDRLDQIVALAPERLPASVKLTLDGVDALDTLGALALHRLIARLRRGGLTVAVVGASPAQCALLMDVARGADYTPPPVPVERPFLGLLERIGHGTVGILDEALRLLSFFGLVTITGLRVLRDPRRMRITAFIYHLEQTGLNALPIVGLLSFLIGVVLAYQGADQLRRFGADIFVVNLLGVAILREIGVLMTSIIIAGRSGSAFTAQLGTMKVTQEVDAMQVLALDPVELLVLPRVLALAVALPLLGIYADAVGLLGGAVMSYFRLDITLGQFLRQLQYAVSPTTLAVGLVKAPVFAMVIAMVGCYEGFKVSGSAESVGQLTTRSVVESIFLVIVLDAIFSIFFSILHV